MITCLAGGIGAAKLLQGFSRTMEPEDLAAVVNVGDDSEFYGLRISPDLDIICYTLAGIVDPEKGWGIQHDSFNCQSMLAGLGCETWFRLGDKDLAFHIFRTLLLRQGFSLTKATERICQGLGVKSKILPCTNDPLRTRVATKQGILEFQEYFVRREAADEVEAILYHGAEEALPSPGVIECLKESDLIVICPSNPFLSIGPILAVKAIAETLKKAKAKVVAVSPIVGGTALKGPTDRIMKNLKIEVSALGVARIYQEYIHTLVIDYQDVGLKPRIQELGIVVHCTRTVMSNLDSKIQLAKNILEISRTG